MAAPAQTVNMRNGDAGTNETNAVCAVPAPKIRLTVFKSPGMRLSDSLGSSPWWENIRRSRWWLWRTAVDVVTMARPEMDLPESVYGMRQSLAPH